MWCGMSFALHFVGTMSRKLVEFLELCQGNRSVYDYTQEFNNLAQYRGHHVNNDVMKVDLYRKTA
jgi:hypothetical protein